MEHKVWNFEKISDFLALEHDEFERMLPDFKEWFKLTKGTLLMADLINRQLKQDGSDAHINIQAGAGFKWKDDGEVGKATLAFNQKHFVNDELIEEKTTRVSIEQEAAK